MNNIISKYKAEINKRLDEKLVCENELHKVVFDAMKYSLSVGGKRIRPCLVMEFAEICGGNKDAALDMACAIEMIHTYSLIHDDLPCMDNDDLRRGLPSCHKKFGEDIALLAGDGLLTQAFITASSCCNTDNDNVVKCISILASCAGSNGMIGGQVIDLQSEGKSVGVETLSVLNALKTSKLIEASAMMGCAISGACSEKIKAAQSFGYNLGIAFQIVDDILDIVGDSQLMGKPIGSDEANKKSTFVSLLGMEKAQALADEYTNKALDALSVFGEAANNLKEFSKELLNRNH